MKEVLAMKLVGKIFIILALCFFATQTVVPAADKGVFNTSPKLNDGKKWRVGYYEGGEYIDYQLIFAETVKGLMKLGWIKTAQLPPLKGEETKGLWDWLSTKAQSNYMILLRMPITAPTGTIRSGRKLLQKSLRV